MSDSNFVYSETIDFSSVFLECKPARKALIWGWFLLGLIGAIDLLSDGEFRFWSDLFFLGIFCVWPLAFIAQTAYEFELLWSWSGRRVRLCDSRIRFENIEVASDSPPFFIREPSELEIDLDGCVWTEGFADNDSWLSPLAIPRFFRKKTIEIYVSGSAVGGYGKPRVGRTVYVATCGFTKESFERWSEILNSSGAKKVPNRRYFEPFFVWGAVVAAIYGDGLIFFHLLDDCVDSLPSAFVLWELTAALPFVCGLITQGICRNYCAIQTIRRGGWAKLFAWGVFVPLLLQTFLLFKDYFRF